MTTQTNNNFHSSVDAITKQNLLALAELVKEELISSLNHEAYGCSNLNEIQGYDASGYIAWQLGGYDVTEYYQNSLDSSCHLTKSQAAYLDEYAGYALKDFKRDNDIGEDDDIPEELEDHYYEFENDYLGECLGECLAVFRCWVEDDNETIQIDLGANYKDAPYFRNGSTENIIDFSIPKSLFNNFSAEKWLEVIKKKINKSDTALHTV